MAVPNMAITEFMQQSPEQMYILLTSAIYDARKRGAAAEIDAILSVFDADARRALLVGASALLAMAPGDYRDALKAATCETLYDLLREG